MTPSEREFLSLMRQIQNGSNEAAVELSEKYGEQLLRVIRSRMRREMRSEFDSGDFLQSLWKSFFAKGEKTPKFDTPEDLLRYLRAMASNKVSSTVRKKFGTQKRKGYPEESLESMSDIPSSDPSPSHQMRYEETLEQASSGIQQNLEILRLRSEGLTMVEIACRVGVSTKTVSRAIKTAADRIKKAS